MAERRVYSITIRVRSPFMFEGTASSKMGVDSSFLKNEEGRPIIPATQIRGVLLAALAQNGNDARALLDKKALRFLFGDKSNPNGDGAPNAPERGVALFSDLVGPPARDSLQTTRIRIDEETGAVARGALQVIELSHPMGSVCDFVGGLVVRWRDPSLAHPFETAIAKALRLIPAIGAYKSAGFGEVVPDGCAFAETERRSLSAATPAEARQPTRQGYRVTFDRPLLVDSRQVEGNQFHGATIVPGSVFKGALAERLKVAGEDPETGAKLGPALSQARFSHAFPLDEKGKATDLPLPMSLIANADAFADLSSLAQGQSCLWDGKPAAFVCDGKDKTKKAARHLLGLAAANLPDVERTHVKIDPESLAAEDTALFSFRAVSTVGRSWAFEIDTGRVADRELASRLVRLVGQGLDGIGKTGACATLTAQAASGDDVFEGDEITLMLTTPAVMFDPAKAAATPASEVYKSYFSERLGGAALQNWFARRSLSGGYVATRYRAYGGAYYPFVLTAPGSVFRLRCATSEAKAAVGQALRYGLPVALLDGAEPTWRTCAFVPENGFGAIMRNPSAGLMPASLQIVEAAHVR